jgi:hypothetical protein
VPLTVCHPAAAWPVRRFLPRLPLDAVVLGTMAPDFEYVLRLSVGGGSWHRPRDFFFLAIPTALLACVLFRFFVRPAFAALLPRGLVAEPGERGWIATVAAAVVGALTHVFWDGFTHRTGWFVSLVPVLGEPAPGLPIPWFSLLQHGSTLVGGLLIAAWVAAEVRARPAEARIFAPGQARRAMTVGLSIIAICTLASIANGARVLGTPFAATRDPAPSAP